MKYYKGYKISHAGDKVWMIGKGCGFIGSRATLREAFQWINENANAPNSMWDDLKDAAKEWKHITRNPPYMGDDDRGIYNEGNWGATKDAIWDFLEEHDSLHLIGIRS